MTTFENKGLVVKNHPNVQPMKPSIGLKKCQCQKRSLILRNKVVTKPQAQRNCDVISFQSDMGTDGPTDGPTNQRRVIEALLRT
jgi:hypothetical protein